MNALRRKGMSVHYRACATYGPPTNHNVHGRARDDREAAERDLQGWMPPHGRALRGWIEERQVGSWQRNHTPGDAP